MNGNPTAEQARFQNNDLREMGCIVTGRINIQVHHIFGSKTKFKYLSDKGITRPGEWFVIPLCPETHKEMDDNKYSFDAERGLFLSNLRKYQILFDCPAPVPLEVVEYYKAMLNKQDTSQAMINRGDLAYA